MCEKKANCGQELKFAKGERRIQNINNQYYPILNDRA